MPGKFLGFLTYGQNFQSCSQNFQNGKLYDRSQLLDWSTRLLQSQNIRGNPHIYQNMDQAKRNG